MSYISVVANNGLGIVKSWEKVAATAIEHRLINLEAKEFEEYEPSVEYTYARYLSRFYVRNRWNLATVPLPAELPCEKMFIDDDFEEREVPKIDVTPTREVLTLDYSGKGKKSN